MFGAPAVTDNGNGTFSIAGAPGYFGALYGDPALIVSVEFTLTGPTVIDFAGMYAAGTAYEANLSGLDITLFHVPPKPPIPEPTTMALGGLFVRRRV